MSAQKRKEEINLLPEKGFESTTTGRILAWILSTFRVIVIVTEIIVMMAFLSRFWLDAQNSDLNDNIDQKKAVLAASQNFEKQFKAAQERLKIFSTLTANQTDINLTLKLIVESLPPDVVLSEILISDRGIEISGNTPNEKSIHQLSVNLNSKDQMSEFTVTEINTDLRNSTVLNFTVKGIQT